MYLIETRGERNGSQMLIERPARELLAVRNPWPRFEQVTASRAHRWVRQDWPHETALYLDLDKRIRRAQG